MRVSMRGAVRRAISGAAAVVAVAWVLCVAPLSAHAFALSPAAAAPAAASSVTAEVASAPEIGEDESDEEIRRLAAIEGQIIADSVQSNWWSWVPGVISAIVTSLLGLMTTVVVMSARADRKRTDETMQADRTRADQRTDQLVATLKEQNDIMRQSHASTLETMRAADENNQRALERVTAEVARNRDTHTGEIQAVRTDMVRGFERLDTDIRELDKRVAVIESPGAAASTTRGRRKDTL